VRALALLWLGLLFAAPSAHALTSSAAAFRWENAAEGNVWLGDEEAVIEPGEVYGTVVLLWGNLTVRGQVKEVVVLSGTVVFAPGAKLEKNLSVMGGSFEVQPGAFVAPEKINFRSPGPLWRVVQSSARVFTENVSGFLWVGLIGFWILICWGGGLFLFLIFPALRNVTVGRLQSQWPQNLAVALLAIFAAPAFAGLLFISILGIVLIPFYLLLLGALGFVAYLGAALWAGHRLLPPKPGRELNPWGFLLGLIAFQVLWTISHWWAVVVPLILWLLAGGGLLRGARALWR